MPEPIKHPSLSDDGARLVGELSEIRGRLIKIADMLHGSTPRDASGKDVPPPPNSVRRNIDSAFNVVSDISHELTRIEAGL